MFPGILDSIYFYWSICLFSAALVLNSVAILVLLKTSTSILKDQSVVTLFYVLGINLLQLVMVKIFDLHSHSLGRFIFPPELCRIIRINCTVLADIGFPAIGIQLACSLRSIRKDRYRYYTWFSLCFGKLTVITLATVLAVLVNTVHQTLNIDTDKCLENVKDSPHVLVTIRHSLILGLPLLFILFVLLTLLPRMCRIGKKSKSSYSIKDSQVKLDLAATGEDKNRLLYPPNASLEDRGEDLLSLKASQALDYAHLELEANSPYNQQQLITSQQLTQNFGAKKVGPSSKKKMAENGDLRDMEDDLRELPDSCYVDQVQSRDISLLILLAVTIALCRAPKVILHYNKVLNIEEVGELMRMLEEIFWDLPLILIPTAIITIRQSSTSTCCSTQQSYSFQDTVSVANDGDMAIPLSEHGATTADGSWAAIHNDWDSVDREEEGRLVVSMEGKELENAIFKSKTTTL